MLESRSLWISPSSTGRGTSSGLGVTTRTVRGAFDRAAVGEIAAHPLRWWPWTIVATISAYEGPDRSALFAGRRTGWLPGDWDVHEADGRLVGLVRGNHVLHAGGEILGRIARVPRGAAGSVIGPGGSRLAGWSPQNSGTRIEFSAELDEQPFAKMAVLIAVLIGL